MITAATSASKTPSKIAAWMARKFDPPPETKTAMRFFGKMLLLLPDVDGVVELKSGGVAFDDARAAVD